MKSAFLVVTIRFLYSFYTRTVSIQDKELTVRRLLDVLFLQIQTKHQSADKR